MKWDELENFIPYVPEDGPNGHVDIHSQSNHVYTPGSFRIDALLPGVHWRDTKPRGGDFVIEVTSATARTLSGSTWTSHRFTHTELFQDTQEKTSSNSAFVQSSLAPALVEIVAEGADPLDFQDDADEPPFPGLEPLAYLMVGQVLALCESRRFRDHEPLGGRCLPLRLALGIMFTRWSDGAAMAVWRRGKGGLAQLRNRHGPEPTLQAVLGRSLHSPTCNE